MNWHFKRVSFKIQGPSFDKEFDFFVDYLSKYLQVLSRKCFVEYEHYFRYKTGSLSIRNQKDYEIFCSNIKCQPFTKLSAFFNDVKDVSSLITASRDSKVRRFTSEYMERGVEVNFALRASIRDRVFNEFDDIFEKNLFQKSNQLAMHNFMGLNHSFLSR